MRTIACLLCCLAFAACGASNGASGAQTDAAQRVVADLAGGCDAPRLGADVRTLDARLADGHLDATIRLSDHGGKGRATTLRKVAQAVSGVLDACGRADLATQVRAGLR